jgi:hypothetical protein
MEEFTEKELHCIARLLQGAIYGEHNVFDGCAFCKYNCQIEGDPNPDYEKTLEKLTRVTGVNLLPMCSTLFHSKFPYKKFLKNANENVKEYFRNYFKNI